jgi:hypothetical protein
MSWVNHTESFVQSLGVIVRYLRVLSPTSQGYNVYTFISENEIVGRCSIKYLEQEAKTLEEKKHIYSAPSGTSINVIGRREAQGRTSDVGRRQTASESEVPCSPC